jgi:cysteine desulfurase
VLVAMGRGAAEARETVRFSLGHASAEADVDAAVAAVGQALQVLAPGGSEGGRLVDQEAAR